MSQNDSSDMSPGALDATISWKIRDADYENSGLEPKIAINDGLLVIELHVGGSGQGLWYSLGVLEADGAVNWGQHHPLPDVMMDSGPAIAMDDSGNIVTLELDLDLNIYYRIGGPDDTPFIGKAIPCNAEGINPSVSLNNNGIVVQFYEGTKGLSYRIGELEASQGTISWQAPTAFSYSAGHKPAVGINDNGVVILLLEADVGFPGSNGQLWQYVGQLQPDGQSIVWQHHVVYDLDGVHPGVAINNAGIIVQVNRDAHDELWYRIGKLDGQTVTWTSRVALSQKDKDKGQEPAVSLTQSNNVIAVYRKESTHTLRLSTGVVEVSS
ncbi:MAG TPA: hypothetical protein VJ464_06260 [Blastocatellia bacterium]|nr:hypothetical protein [Blastocatellia bacterium]